MELPTKPRTTLADHLAVSIGPVLIMLLVGSLSFFLIEVFFKGPATGSVRWVMFWFVMAVVLVSRIGIEEGTGHAAAYGLSLAAVTWLYLMFIHPSFILGMILLGIVWWCAHKLTWDCTLIDEDADASGGGLLETVASGKEFRLFGKKAPAVRDPQLQRPPPHSPGLWVVYFSLAALPIFGFGQLLLPAGDVAARRTGFALLFVYVSAALGLLLSTSFLGLRRYLRQRYLPMPPMIAFGWIRFGAGVAAFVLLGALLLPRPGANAAWQALRYHVDYQLRQASEYAARFNPPGHGKGREGTQGPPSDTGRNSANAPSPAGSPPDPNAPAGETTSSPDTSPQSALTAGAGQLYQWFKILFLLALAALAGWWLYRRRELILQIIRSLIDAIRQFLSNLFQFGSSPKAVPVAAEKVAPKRRLFAAFQNPFLTGKETVWTPEQVLLYSYEALQAWAEGQACPLQPEQTAREFCRELGGRFPEVDTELDRFAFLYSHAAYGKSVPVGSDLEPVKKLWRFLSAQ